MLPPRDSFERMLGSRVRAEVVRVVLARRDGGIRISEFFSRVTSRSGVRREVLYLEASGVLRRAMGHGSYYLAVVSDHPMFLALQILEAACGDVDRRILRPDELSAQWVRVNDHYGYRGWYAR